jgi:hypothetical protein
MDEEDDEEEKDDDDEEDEDDEDDEESRGTGQLRRSCPGSEQREQDLNLRCFFSVMDYIKNLFSTKQAATGCQKHETLPSFQFPLCAWLSTFVPVPFLHEHVNQKQLGKRKVFGRRM